MLWKHTTVYLELLEVTLEPKARKFRFQVGGHSSAPLVSKAHSGQHLTGPLLELAEGLDQAGRSLACTLDNPPPPSFPTRGLGPSDPGCAPGSWDSRNQRGVPQEGSGGEWISGPTTRQAGEAAGPEFQANWRPAKHTPRLRPASLPGLHADHSPHPDSPPNPTAWAAPGSL